MKNIVFLLLVSISFNVNAQLTDNSNQHTKIYVPKNHYQSWRFGDDSKSITQIQNILFDTGNQDIQSLVIKAKRSQKRQYLGLLSIPFGISAIALAVASYYTREKVPVSTANNYGVQSTTYEYQNTKQTGTYLISAGAGGIITAATIFIGVNAKHNKRKFRKQAIELYNQTY